MAHGEGHPAAEHAFDVVLRGYDRRQVDDHIAALDARLAATGRECSELRMQRDTAANRTRDLENRLNSGPLPAASAGAPSGGAPAPSAAPSPAAPPAAPSPTARPGESWSLDGLGAKVESILRVAAEEADAIRRSAEASTRQHAEAEVRVRSTFEGISERLQPLVARLDEESTAARGAVQGTASEATAFETAARQQTQAMMEAATATAARMRADAETRVEVTSRQVADVREELALVRQILSSLGHADGGTPGRPAAAEVPGPMEATAPVGRASAAGGPPASAASSDAVSPHTMPVSTMPTPGGDGSAVSMSKPGQTSSAPADDQPHLTQPDTAGSPQAQPGSDRGMPAQPTSDDDTQARPTSDQGVPAQPESAQPQSAQPQSAQPRSDQPQSEQDGQATPESAQTESAPTAAPADFLPPGFRGAQPRSDAPRPAASDAPTETIALPLTDADQTRQGGYPSPGRSPQQSG